MVEPRSRPPCVPQLLPEGFAWSSYEQACRWDIDLVLVDRDEP